MKLFLLAAITVAVPLFALTSAYGDGLASETLPPEMIGTSNVTLSIATLPFSTSTNNSGTQLNIALLNSKTLQPIPYATLAVTTLKGQNVIFSHTFQSDSGNFILRFYPSIGAITYNKTANVQGNSSGQNSGYYQVTGPIFNSGGLYRFKVDVLSMNSYSNQINASYNSGISIPEYDNLTVNDPNYGSHQVQIVAYYDQLKNIRYDEAEKFINFTMPFDWSYNNMKQVTVVHQEIRIPRALGDFMVTKYDAYVNNIKLPDKSISIDDYSLGSYRTVHLILYRQDVERLASNQNPSQEMNFALRPSNETAFPVIHFTRNAQYEVALSWNPPIVAQGSHVQFHYTVIDPYHPNSTLAPISYSFSVLDDTNRVIFYKNEHTSGLEEIQGVALPPGYTGPITISFDNLDNNTFANAQFITTVVGSSTVPEFPFASFVIGIIFSLAIFVQIIFNPRLVRTQSVSSS